MIAMEAKSLTNGAATSPLSSSGGSQNPSYPASSVQPDMHNQGQSSSIPSASQSPRKQLLSHSIENTMPSAGVPNSTNLPPALPSTTELIQTTMSNVIGQSFGLQNMYGVWQNFVNNSVGQGVQSSTFANSQRPMKARQQVAPPQHQDLQNDQLLIYYQQLQQQVLNQKLHQGIHPSFLQQSHIQQLQLQQTLSQPAHMQQPSQQSLMQMTQPSGLQSSPPTFQQAYPSLVPLVQQSSLQHNQQSVLRKQQQSQQSAIHQQQTSIVQQKLLSSEQQQQQLIGQQANAINMQQNQIAGQKNGVPHIQQQPHQEQHQMLLGQQNYLSDMQQNSASNLHQQQKQLGLPNNVLGQQLLGQHPGVSNMQQQQHSILPTLQTKVSVQQQEAQQALSILLPPQGQQSRSQQSQQKQLMPQLQSQHAQLQQESALQQQQLPNTLQRALQQRLQISCASLDCTAQTGHLATADSQEENYRKLNDLKDMYLFEINELHQKFALKCQQPQMQSDRLKKFKNYLEHIIANLQLPKSSISHITKKSTSSFEKKIIGILNMSKRKTDSEQQQQQGKQKFQTPCGQTHSMQQHQQQLQTQISQLQQHDNHVKQVQPMNLQGSVTSMQSTVVTNVQHGSIFLSSHMGDPTMQLSMRNTLQPGSTLDSTRGLDLSFLQQSAMGSTQQAIINTMSQSSLNPLQSNINPLQPSSNGLQHQQHMKQHQKQQPMLQTQPLKHQLCQHHMHHQQHKQQMLQQQFHQQQQRHQQHQFAQLQLHQMQQLYHINEPNELKVIPGMDVTPGLFQQHHPKSQSATYHQLKTSLLFPVSSPHHHQATSPQISQHSSQQIDQQNMLISSIPKGGTPPQPLNSPSIVPSPSTSLPPSPIPGDNGKHTSDFSSPSNAGVSLSQVQSLAIDSPGISPSPLLEQCSGQGDSSVLFSGNKSSAIERPFKRLIEVITSISPNAFISSVSDIGSVVNMTDRIAGSAPGNGSRAAVGEDLVAMTKYHLHGRKLMSRDGSAAMTKMRRHTSVLPLNTLSSAGSINSSLRKQGSLEKSEIESTPAYRIKRQRVEGNSMLLEAIKEINQRLIDTVVNISDGENDSTATLAEGREGIVIDCSFNAVVIGPNMKSQAQYALPQMSPILLLRLLVPSNYPNCSPILLDQPLVEPSNDIEDLLRKAKSKFSISVRSLSQPMSLGEMARTWDVCAREVITEYVRKRGGGSFSSRFGSWETCVGA